MADVSDGTAWLHVCISRWQAGDRAAADELLRVVGSRLEQLGRRMLKGYPNVRRWADTGDVLQGALVRLLHTLRSLRPASTRDFLNLSAVHIRRELIDLARYFAARGRDMHCPLPGGEEGTDEVADTRHGSDELDRWAAFHAAVERLPAEERETFMLAFYHGWPHRQIADLFCVDERTIRRRWRAACLALSAELVGKLPEP